MTEFPDRSVAIIGMAGRFPGASSVAPFWQNILNGVESISRFDPSELEDNFDAATRELPNFVPVRSVLENVELFDAPFFGMLPREAAMTDPQQRILLECAWEALEDAGYDPATSGGPIGVFAGATSSTYLLHHLFHDRASVAAFTSGFQVGNLPMLLGSAADFTATRIGYKLGLTGPCVAVQSACSTSLLAVAQAVQSLLCHGCDMALAGGVSITLPQRRGYLAQDGGMVSTDGHCRVFDSRANGTVFGSGAGLVVLKRLDDALADGDHIHAVIRGVGINNDGATKVGFTAPSVDGQAAAIVMAQAAAQVDARSIGYIECHGTGTPMGDPIEVAALTAAFRTTTEDVGFCALGSVKSNIGHLDVAAGVAGLIKAALAVSTGTVPASLHVTEPNPALDLPHSPFFVADRPQDWPISQGPRRAGVSAFGVGGTNVHLVLEQAPALASQPVVDRTQILPVSARSATALMQARARLADHLEAHPEQDLADVAFTLQTGRRHFPYRSAATGRNRAELIKALRAPSHATPKAVTGTVGDVVFMFPGQGAQHRQMGRELYASAPVYRETVDLCSDILRPHLGLDLRTQIYPSNGGDHADDMSATVLAQPAIFSVEYALARLLMSWGLKPAAMIGHSVGEFAAACLAGVFSLEDALSLIATRGRLMQGLPGGAMLAVRLPASELTALARDGIAVAAINAPGTGVLAGSFPAIEALEVELARRNVMHRRLQTSHAFHSDMIDPIIDPLTQAVAQVQLCPPDMPYISGVTGAWVTEEQATSPAYWARHARETVRFADGIATLVRDLSATLLEVGPGTALSSFALQGAAADGLAVSCLPTAQGDADAMLHAAVARLWTAGVLPDWAAYHSDIPRRRIPLPTYPFERSRHWVDAPAPSLVATTPSTSSEFLLASQPDQDSIMPAPAVVSAPDFGLINRVAAIFEDLSGRPFEATEHAAGFLSLGFDSLLLTQAAQSLQTNFGVQIRFRQFFDELICVNDVARHIAELQPPQVSVIEPPTLSSPSVERPAQVPTAVLVTDVGRRQDVVASLETLMREQLDTMSRLMNRQLQVLSGAPASLEPARSAQQQPETVQTAVSARPTIAAAPMAEEPKAPPTRFRPIQKTRQTDGLDDRQRDHIARLTARYVTRTAGSKKLASAHRAVLADPRTVSGFAADWKEMVYPIVAARAKGAYIWDIDGNSYIDLVNGYGQTAFGHAPSFVVEAVQAQLSQGFAIGPQSPLALEAAKLFCDLTGHARVAFCNTGSEAVMAALRVARTVTGRDRVVTFAGAYHGQFDEVLVRGIGAGENRRASPASPGIPAEAVGRLTVLDYGTDESLVWIRAHAHELAAVLVEPVQSRRPGFLPTSFLKDVRAITARSGTALILDEVVTGFRVHPAGVQALIDVEPDLATYGKVVGGGMPIGLLAGAPRFMDALDGGMWQFGDDSVPEVGVTFFAGTFVRHPLALAAMVAVLKHVKEKGLALQDGLTASMCGLVEDLRAAFKGVGWDVPIESYGSVLYFEPGRDHRLGSLLFHHLRARGIFIQEHYPCFLTTEHGEAEIAAIAKAFRESLEEMRRDGMLPSSPSMPAESATPAAQQPDELPLTEAQMEIWLSAQAGPEASAAFNESVSLTFDGALDVARLAEVVRSVAARHAILQATFAPDGTKMRIAPSAAFPVSVIDLNRQNDPHKALHELIEARAYEPFDLVEGPVAEAQIVRLADKSHVLVFSAHHIVCDGWSTNILLDEIATAYRSGIETLPVPISFAVHATQRDGELIKASEAYWTKIFSDIPAALELPTDRPRPPLRSFNGGTQTLFIGADLYRSVKTTGARYRSTLFSTLFSAFQVLLFKLSDQRDLVIGVPAAGQSAAGSDRLVGHCVNFLPIRDQIDPALTFVQHLDRTGRIVLDAYDHQNCTLGALLKRLRIPPVSGRLPLVEVQFNLERLGDSIDFGSGLRAQAAPNPKMFSTFDLYFNITESSDGLRADCCYNADLFDAATIDRWFGHFHTLLAAFVAQPDITITDMPLLDAAERQRAVFDLNRTQTAAAAEQDVIAAFEAQAHRQPDTIAVSFGEDDVSYSALNAWADRIAGALRQRFDLSEPRIALLIERSPALVAAMLGALKAGFPYVPLDPAMPKGRIRSILRDSEAVAILAVETSDPTSFGLDIEIETIDINQAAAEPSNAPRHFSPDELAYVIYTSGSTGAPKGVEVTRGGLTNLLSAMADEPGFDRADTLLAVTTVTFDIAALELLLPLVQGGHVVMASSYEVKDPVELMRLQEKRRATVMQATPMTWRLLLEAGFKSRPGLRMFCGGEALPLELARGLLAGGGELWNMYGPTETTIWSSVERIHPEDEIVTIGRPITNTQFYVVDANDQLAPIGVPGELLIAGAGVARGYAGNPKLTARSFIRDPFATDPSARAYRSGDRVQYLADGRIQHLGRLDQQIKLRGFRIEPGEIEAVLARKAGIVSVVILREDVANEPTLVCYHVPPVGDQPSSPSVLRSLLAEEVPDYMVPTVWVNLPALPLNASGKIDRAALPAPGRHEPVPKAERIAPGSAIEETLCRIWCEVLRREDVGVKDDLFDLGADSLSIFQITARARREGLKLAARDLFRNRTIAGLAAALAETAEPEPIKSVAQPFWKRAVRRQPVVSLRSDQSEPDVVLQREQR